MQRDDAQLGRPFKHFRGTKAEIEALTGLVGGEEAHATDSGDNGVYDEILSRWVWFKQHTHDGWNVIFDTLTYASANTFTISGDWTSVFTRGVKMKLTQTSVKYFSVVKSTHSSGTTTVTVTGGSDYSLANAAITSPYYSNWENPASFPATFSWAPTFGGFSADPTGTYVFRILPQGMYVDVQQSVNGTSNSTSFSISAPPGVTFPAGSPRLGLIYAAIDNSLVVATTPGYVQSNAGGTQYDVSKDFTSGITGWKNSNGKRCRFTLMHPIAS